jgi:hypothetical protein
MYYGLSECQWKALLFFIVRDNYGCKKFYSTGPLGPRLQVLDKGERGSISKHASLLHFEDLL